MCVLIYICISPLTRRGVLDLQSKVWCYCGKQHCFPVKCSCANHPDYHYNHWNKDHFNSCSFPPQLKMRLILSLLENSKALHPQRCLLHKSKAKDKPSVCLQGFEPAATEYFQTVQPQSASSLQKWLCAVPCINFYTK